MQLPGTARSQSLVSSHGRGGTNKWLYTSNDDNMIGALKKEKLKNDLLDQMSNNEERKFYEN